MGRIMIAGTNSGCGKTTITCGILNCLLRREINLHAFKCGPDYIDPMFHSKVLGILTGNLDSYFTKEDTLHYLLGKSEKKGNISVIEGVMGYYDGIAFSQRGSSEAAAIITKTPVVLILNCRGMSRSIFAMLKGFLSCETTGKNKISGVIFNMLSESMYEEVKKMAYSLGIKPIGFVPKQRAEIFPSRHLGLITADEIKDFKKKLDEYSNILEKTLDLDGLIKLSEQAELLEYKTPDFINNMDKTPIKIAVAKDKAFCFLYNDNIDLLEKMGCEICYFSPLEEKDLPENINGLILSGGYPELFARQLSSNTELLIKIKERILGGLPTIAECGGFMYLHEKLEDINGEIFPLAGVISGLCFKTEKMQRFGYMELVAQVDNLLCKKGEKIKSHEFHYWDSENPGDSFLAGKPERNKSFKAAYTSKTCYAGFPHFYFYGNPSIAVNFINAARNYTY